MDLRSGILSTAQALGINPLDLATAISYETAGTFDPTKAGPTTQWGQHRGLIQFGEPQAQKYGVDWNNPVASQLGPQGAVANYLRDTGVQPGMGLLDIYSAINAGGVGRYDRSDANNGGAPGTVRDKVESQMAGHRQKALSLLGELDQPQQTMSTRSPQTEAPQMQDQQATGLLGKLFPNMTADRQDRLAVALSGLSMHPNQGVMQMAGQRMADRRADGKEAKQANRTLEMVGSLINQGILPPHAMAVAKADPRAGIQMASTAINASRDPNVQSSQMLPDMTGTVMTMRDGSLRVVTAGGETLTGQSAMEFVQRSNTAYTDQQRDIYGARREGTLQADTNLGGEAARVVEEGKRAPGTASEFGQQASLIRSSITNMNEAIAAIDRGANSGVVYKMLPALGEASASLRNSMNRLGLDVIGSVTFGALSAAEMQLAMETAVPQNLSPPDLREWLMRKQAAQQKAYQAAMEAAQHFASGGSQAEYYQMIGVEQPQAAQPAPTSGATHRFNPDTGQVEPIR